MSSVRLGCRIRLQEQYKDLTQRRGDAKKGRTERLIIDLLKGFERYYSGMKVREEM
jgi:hypothetical protein